MNGCVAHINTLGDQASRDAYRKALVDYFQPHKDVLCEDCQVRLEKNPLRLLDCKVDSDTDLFKNAPNILDYLNEKSKNRFQTLCDYLDLLQVEYVVDPKIVRGLDYYNHTVFEIHADIKEFGNANVLGGGGRYNGLVEQLGGPSTPCFGFAAGMDRLVMALKASDVSLPVEDSLDAFILYVNEDEKKYAAFLSQELRMAGFSIDTDYTNKSLKAQFRQADRFHSKYLILLNSADLKDGLVTIKNQHTKEEEKILMEYVIYYLDEHLIDLECCDDENCTHCHDEE